jgi:hypothetical protein
MIRKEFSSYKMNEEGVALSNKLSELYTNIADFVEGASERCPELMISLRKLEESCFYARKSIAMNHQVAGNVVRIKGDPMP